MPAFPDEMHSKARDPRPLAVSILALIVLWLVLCRPWFWGGRVVPFDSKDQFYPTLSFVSQSLRAGELPCWNPYVYSGYPLCSDPQSMIFSPIALGLMLLKDKPSVQWFDAVELLHLLLGAVGILLLSARFGWSSLAGLLSALIYMFGGSAAARMQHVPIILAYGYFPFALLTLHLALETRRIAWAICSGLLAGIIAAHQVQVSYLFGLTLIGYSIYRVLSAESVRGFLATRWKALAATGGTALLVLAIPIYLTLQFLPLSNRPQIPYEVAVAGSQNPLAFLTLFMRNFFGSSNLYLYWGPGDITETYLYTGILPIVLIFAYGIPTGLLFERRFRYCLSVGIFAILFAAGKFTPLYWLLYHVVPGMNLYRRPADATFLINMVLALAAGLVMDRVLAGSPMQRRLLLVGAELGILTVLFGAGLQYANRHGKIGPALKDLWLTVLYVAIAWSLLHAMAATRSHRVRLALGAACVALAAIDLGVYNAGSRINATDARFVALFADGLRGKDPLTNFLARGLDLEHQAGGPYRAQITYAGPLWANAPELFGIPSAQGYNPIRLRLYEQVAGAQESGNTPLPVTPMMPALRGPMLNMLGVRYIVSDRIPAGLTPENVTVQFPSATEKGAFRVWANPEAMPRAMIATSVYMEPDLPRAIAEGPIPPLDFRSTVVLEHLPSTLPALASSPRTPLSLAGRGDARARIVSYRAMEITLEVHTERDAIAILNDPYYPYWRVYVDGRERELLQANYLFRGVHVRPGERRIVFRFEPFSVPAIKGTWARLRSAKVSRP